MDVELNYNNLFKLGFAKFYFLFLGEKQKQSNFTENKRMKTLEKVQKKLIDRILTSKNEKLLVAIDKIFDYTHPEVITALFTEELEMLLMSEKENEL